MSGEAGPLAEGWLEGKFCLPMRSMGRGTMRSMVER
jgi:hypothetical protein